MTLRDLDLFGLGLLSDKIYPISSSFYDIKPDGGGGGGGKKILRHPSPRATHAQMMTKRSSKAERGEEVSLPIVK